MKKKIKGLYKGKYLIASYKGDNLEFVADNARDIVKELGEKLNTIKSRICRGQYYLIDVTQVHDDCFLEEDKVFLQEFLWEKR